MSLQTILDNCVRRINLVFTLNPGLFKTVTTSWNQSWSTIFDEERVPERTVRNWLVPSIVAQINIPDPPSPPNVVNLQRVVNIIVRTIESAIAAQNAGRITLTQANDLENAFDSTWPP
jgi:hypothetical protein